VGKSKPSLKSNDKEGFIRAFTDEWADLEAEYQAHVMVGLEPTGRKGVFRLVAVAVWPAESDQEVERVKYACEYPTAAVESLEACLFRCLIRLGRTLRDRKQFPMGKA